MGLVQLYEKQDRDLDSFDSLRDKTWSDMKRRQEHLISAFGSKDSLPEFYRKQIDKEIADFVKEWSAPHGERYKGMVLENQKHLKELTPKQPPKNQSPNRSKSSYYSQSLSSNRAKKISPQRAKSPEKFKGFDENRDSIGI